MAIESDAYDPPAMSTSAPTAPTQETFTEISQRQSFQDSLDGMQVLEFLAMSPEWRHNRLLCRLKISGPVVVDETGDDGWLSPEALERQPSFFGRRPEQESLVAEIWKIYYAENEFIIQSSCLRAFMNRKLNGSSLYQVRSLVKNITVTVNMYRQDEKTRLREDLQELLRRTNPNKLTIQLRGGGAIDAIDLDSQLVLRDISLEVASLFGRFRERFTIEKVQEKTGSIRSIRSYWDLPSESARFRITSGESWKKSRAQNII